MFVDLNQREGVPRVVSPERIPLVYDIVMIVASVAICTIFQYKSRGTKSRYSHLGIPRMMRTQEAGHMPE